MTKYVPGKKKMMQPSIEPDSGITVMAPGYQWSVTNRGGPVFFLIILFTVIAFQGFFELESNSTSFIGSVATWLGNKVLRFGLYACLGLIALWLLRHKYDTTNNKPKSGMGFILFFYFELLLVILLGSLQIWARNIVTTTLGELRQMIEIIVLVPIVYAGVQHINEIRRVINWFTNLLTIIALLNIFGYLSRFTSFLSLPVSSYFAFIILFGAVYSWARYLVSRMNVWNLIQCVVLFIGANITFLKPVVVCGFFGFFITWLIVFLKGNKQRGLSRSSIVNKTLLILFMTTIIFLLVNWVTSNNLYARYKYQFDTMYIKIEGGGQIDGNRFFIWNMTWNDIFLKSPWVGSGWGVRLDLSYASDVYVHNLFIYWLACTGIVGGVILLLLITSIAGYIKRHFNWREDVEIKAGLLGYLAILLVQNMIGDMFAEAALTFTLGLTIALALKIATLDAERIPVRS